MRSFIFLSLLSFSFLLACRSNQIPYYKNNPAEMVGEGIISTDKFEFRCCLTKDSNIIFFSAIGWDKDDSMNIDIYYSYFINGKWSNPVAVPFSTKYNEFDPMLAPNGKELYFCSNRDGSIGGSDIWQIPFNGRVFGRPVNLGPSVNSHGDEWGPSLSKNGQILVFATNGRGGFGKHDLFRCTKSGGTWTPAENLGPRINSIYEEFDPFVVGSIDKIIFASDRFGGFCKVDLWETEAKFQSWTTPVNLGENINRKDWDYCPFFSADGNTFYFTSHNRDGRRTKADIWKVKR